MSDTKQPSPGPTPLDEWKAAGMPWPWSTLHRHRAVDPVDRMLDDMLELDLLEGPDGR